LEEVQKSGQKGGPKISRPKRRGEGITNKKALLKNPKLNNLPKREVKFFGAQILPSK